MLDNKNNQNPKPQLTQEQIKQLMSMMQNQKPMSKTQQVMVKVINKLSIYTKETIILMERFINFIIKDYDVHRNNVVQTARGPILFGTYVIIIFVVFGGIWTVFAPLDKASVAIGTVIPSSKRKIIQHREGGIVKKIYVQLGDQVKEGDPLLEIDDVSVKSQYERYLNQYRTAIANENRLIAERDDYEDVLFDEFLTNDISIPEVSILMATQRDLFFSRESVYKKLVESKEKEKLQLEKQLESVHSKKLAIKKAQEVSRERLKSSKELFNKGYINKGQFLEIEAKSIEMDSQLAQIESDVARIEQALAQQDAEFLKMQSQYISDILKELHEAQKVKNEAKESFYSTKDTLERVVIKSPVDGTVIEMHATTLGGIIQQGQNIAEILPLNDHLIIEARVASKDIDSVKVGLKTKIRFSAFKSRTSPVFNGKVVSLSPDIVGQDRQQQMMSPDGGAVYIAKIELDMEEFVKVTKGKLLLRPGMQAEVQIVTGERTLMQYLLDPLTDNMFKAFKEK